MLLIPRGLTPKLSIDNTRLDQDLCVIHGSGHSDYWDRVRPIYAIPPVIINCISRSLLTIHYDVSIPPTLT